MKKILIILIFLFLVSPATQQVYASSSNSNAVEVLLSKILSKIGATGATGSVGETGAQGLVGQTGPTGSIGATGEIGATGPVGPMGATGEIGPRGYEGLMGYMGPTGSTGPQGATGPIGPYPEIQEVTFLQGNLTNGQQSPSVNIGTHKLLVITATSMSSANYDVYYLDNSNNWINQGNISMPTNVPIIQHIFVIKGTFYKIVVSGVVDGATITGILY